MPAQSLETLSRSSKNNSLCLWFASEPDITLERTLFYTALLDEPLLAVRGKSPGAFRGAATFQWYLGPQALAIFLLSAKGRTGKSFMPVLEGSSGSVAACLDDAIEKTSWICDLFGCRADGTSLIRRIVQRTNSGRRRGPVVAISLNEKFLPRDDIAVFLDGRPVLDLHELQKLAARIERIWSAKKAEARSRTSFQLQNVA